MAAAQIAEAGKEFSERLEALRRDSGDTVALDDIAEIVASLLGTLDGDLTATEIHLHRDLAELVEHIQSARNEITAIRPEEIPGQHVPAAKGELDAVVRATEAATQSILDVAEQIGQLAAQVGGEIGERMAALTTQIYEASNFQDITGQRITKVMRTLGIIESKVVALAQALGIDIASSMEPAKEDRDGDAALLNGPQLGNAGNSQAEIDALLADFD